MDDEINITDVAHYDEIFDGLATLVERSTAPALASGVVLNAALAIFASTVGPDQLKRHIRAVLERADCPGSAPMGHLR